MFNEIGRKDCSCTLNEEVILGFVFQFVKRGKLDFLLHLKLIVFIRNCKLFETYKVCKFHTITEAIDSDWLFVCDVQNWIRTIFLVEWQCTWFICNPNLNTQSVCIQLVLRNLQLIDVLCCLWTVENTSVGNQTAFFFSNKWVDVTLKLNFFQCLHSLKKSLYTISLEWI